jgi:hypothetical protein
MPEIEPLPPARPRGSYTGKRRQENPWASYALIVAVPLVLVLLIVAFSALPPYTPNSRAQQQPNPVASSGAGSSAATQAPAATVPVSVYEAEDGTRTALGPTTKTRSVTAASGGVVVTKIGHGTPAGDVRFNDVTATGAGRYTLTIYYLLGDTVAHRLALWVNDKGPTILSFTPSGGTDRIKAYKATVTLAAGPNSIRFSNATQAYGPDLDRITLQPQ